MVSNTIMKYGKNKIPRFIYHLTTKQNYESMLKDGEIKTHTEQFFGEGIFTIDLTNFFKRWNFKSKNGTMFDLQNRLISYTRNKSSEVVMLRIPTQDLDHDKLKIRSQNICFESPQDEWIDKALNITRSIYMSQEYSIPLSSFIKKTPKYIEAYRKLHNINTKEAIHFLHGSEAKKAKLFKQRKEAIEYIYQDNIPITKAQKIGEINIDEVKNSTNYDINKPIKSIFCALLHGNPEEKGALLLNC